jgi:UTP--glucose-1-phosphate uridylyltransferase
MRSDDIMDSQPPAVKQMIDVFDRVDGPVLLVERVPREEISRYGIIDAEPLGPGVYRVRDLVEKPAADQAPSDLGIVGRYLLTPDIFPSLEATAKDRTGEIQLTDGLRALLRHRPLYACEVTGVRHDAGSRLGFLKAQLYFAMKQPDLAGPLKEYLKPFVS